MRSFLLLGLLCAGFSSLAVAAPRSKPRSTTHRAPAPPAKPLSPEQLRGKAVYILGSDVWTIDPRSRRKFLLFKNLFRSSGSNRYGIAWSRDLSQIAYALSDPYAETREPELFVMRWDGSGKRQLSNDQNRVFFQGLQWNPDGKRLLAVRTDLDNNGAMKIKIFDLDGKSVTFQPKDADGKVIGGTSFDPHWSRDGRKILFEFSPQDQQFATSTLIDVSWKVASVDGMDVADFKNDWSNFFVENQSRNGEWRVAENGHSYWERFASDTSIAQGIVWPNEGGFGASYFCPGADGQHFIWQGGFSKWTIGSQGFATSIYLDGIWFSDLSSAFKPRLLVSRGQLVDWF